LTDFLVYHRISTKSLLLSIVLDSDAVMQLIQRKTLVYQEGRSDKVYEVDLCQVGHDRCVVNFRYGRRGGTLREGSETVAAVPPAEAQRVFDRLVNSKLRKGYREATGQSIESAPTRVDTPSVASPASSEDSRKAVILSRLTAAANTPNLGRPSQKEWKLGRVIWRAGELKLTEAVPSLIRLIRGDAIMDYSIAWALGYCGDRRAILDLKQLYESTQTPEHVRRIALEAIFKLSSEDRDQLRSHLLTQLPEQLQTAIQQGSLTQTLQDYLNRGTDQPFSVLDQLYHIDSETIRPALLEVLRSAPFRPNYFKPLRHIFKIAEYRQDAEVYSLLAYRFEKEASMKLRVGHNPRTGEPVYMDEANAIVASGIPWNRAMNPKDPQTCVAYQKKTREYLRRRVWRTLRRLGELDAPEYVTLATGFLLQFSDADAESTRQTSRTRWERTGQYRDWVRREFSNHWDEYARYLVFNHILYENSLRYVLKPRSKAWRCQPPYKPGDPEPANREEAFPQLWEQHPSALLRLLLESQCQPVHHFATKAIRVCEQFCESIDLETLIRLLESPYEVTARFSFELARSRYQPEQPNRALILAIANCTYAPARSQAHQWILDQRNRFLSDSQLIAGLVISSQADTRALARQLLNHAILAEDVARSLIGRIISTLLTVTQGEIATEVTETLFLSFSPQLRNIGLEIVLDLLQHPLPEIQTLGARILLNHATPAADLPPGLIDALLESPYDSVRVIGVRLFGQLPDDVLLGQTPLLLKLLTHELLDMRESIRPGIRRLASSDASFSIELATQLIEKILEPEEHVGVHDFLAQVLQYDLSNWKQSVTRALTLQLLQTPWGAAQEIVGRVLETNCIEWAAHFETGAIAQLTHHEIKAIRDAAKAMLRHLLPTLRTDEEKLLITVLVLESSWEDARIFGQEFFGELLQPSDLTPSIVISICDSNRADIRRFGRDLVSRCFQDQDGQSYLLKFSEHPATDMQLFATQYLETHVANHPDRLQELMPYLMRVLAQVNRARVAKQRIFAFLNAEAVKSEAAARVIAEVLTRQSATIAITDRARALETLLRIHRAYPHVSVPIQVKPVAVKA
jgi:predicted DNA-binding WGR domain protein